MPQGEKARNQGFSASREIPSFKILAERNILAKEMSSGLQNAEKLHCQRGFFCDCRQGKKEGSTPALLAFSPNFPAMVLDDMFDY